MPRWKINNVLHLDGRYIKEVGETMPFLESWLTAFAFVFMLMLPSVKRKRNSYLRILLFCIICPFLNTQLLTACLASLLWLGTWQIGSWWANLSRSPYYHSLFFDDNFFFPTQCTSICKFIRKICRHIFIWALFNDYSQIECILALSFFFTPLRHSLLCVCFWSCVFVFGHTK